jgi:rhamnogalacturonan endolyase
MAVRILALVLAVTSVFANSRLPGDDPSNPFLIKIDDETHIIGNDIWNVTIGRTYGKKLYYKGVELVGRSTGHYVSYSQFPLLQTVSNKASLKNKPLTAHADVDGAANNLAWTHVAPQIYRQTETHTDIIFSAVEGDLHWVLTPTLAGAYQYFVNRALPTLGEFRTLWRLDNETFTHIWTPERDEPMVTFADVVAAKTVKDGTLQRSNGSFITKYDLATFMTNTEGDSLYWGTYGKLRGTEENIGSWYIHGGKVRCLHQYSVCS